ncbi:MAG: hypothetical protein GPOALKHO_000199 [Sodalis sp.]|nr:MAG: hypothetical protein GPOALKHO_000199 [Sodalis sp.]
MLNYPARQYLLEEVADELALRRRQSALPVYAYAGLRLAKMARADEAQHSTPHALSVDEDVVSDSR